MRDVPFLHRGAQLREVGHVAAHLVERRELGLVEQEPEPVVAAAEVVGRDAAAFVEQQADGPGADAPVRAGDEIPLCRAHDTPPATASSRVRTGCAARLPCGTVPASIQPIIASTVSRRTLGPEAVENHAT